MGLFHIHFGHSKDKFIYKQVFSYLLLKFFNCKTNKHYFGVFSFSIKILQFLQGIVAKIANEYFLLKKEKKNSWYVCKKN